MERQRIFAHRLAVGREVQAIADQPIEHWLRQRQDDRLEGHPLEARIPNRDLAVQQLLHAAHAANAALLKTLPVFTGH